MFSEISKILTVIGCILFWGNSYCQTDRLYEDMLNDILQNGIVNENEDFSEIIEELKDHPVCLNTASDRELEECGLFSPFQVYGIITFRQKYGPFFSIYELAGIPGFQRDFLEAIAPLIRISAPGNKPETRKVSKGESLSNFKTTLPVSFAYDARDTIDSRYQGSPFKIASRLNYTMGEKWKFAITYEKDPGEKALMKRKPEHLSGFIRYYPDNILKQIIIGDFLIQRGLGLVHGFGFSTQSDGIQINGFRVSFARPFASTMEYGYYRGIYLESESGSWKYDTFYSFTSQDISPAKLIKTGELFQSVWQTGIHRTGAEIDGADLGRQHVAGAALNRKFMHGAAGVALTLKLMNLSPEAEHLFGAGTHYHDFHGNITSYGILFGKTYEVFGEIGIDPSFKKALLLGWNQLLHPALSTRVNFRWFQPGFTSQYSGETGNGQYQDQQTGLLLGASLSPFSNATMKASLNVKRKKQYDALHNHDLIFYNYILFRYDWKDMNAAEIRITSKEESLFTNTADNSALVQHKFRFQLNSTFSERLSGTCRIEISRSASPENASAGYLMYEHLKFVIGDDFSIQYRYLLFHISDWSNRIYVYEPGVRYSFLFPAFFGSGTNNLITANITGFKWLVLRIKLSHTHYAHRHTTGSGYDTRPGDRIWDIEAQLQVNF